MAEVIFSAANHQAIVDLSFFERWKRGLKAMGEVAKDPDRTDKVLEAYEHLNAGGEARRAKRFYAWHEAEKLFAENRTLDATTVDFEALLRLPEGTLGHEYARFMKERGLTPDIFAAKGELSRETYVIKRLRQTHDLWHVLTGIDTDVPGELELQAFTLSQMRVPSALVLISMGTLRWFLWHPTLPFRVLRGVINGLEAKLLAPIDWESRWSTPLEQLRAELLG